MENFIEYMWYLLSMPFKRVKKQVNMWYMWCKVIGKRFDAIKEDFFLAREEGMIATCSQEMLTIHAADRKLSRYEGEALENFRKRIAMYAEVCTMGGTPAGILLAVRTLGYSGVEIVPGKEFYDDESRWAEFVVLVDLNINRNDIGLEVIKKAVREWKEVGARDSYQFYLCISDITLETAFDFRIYEVTDTLTWYLDGTYTLYGKMMSMEEV